MVTSSTSLDLAAPCATAVGPERSAIRQWRALARGYATTSTDTGHSTAGGSFALGHCEKLIDYAYRPEHEMTVKAKAIIKAFYGSADAIGIEPEA